MIDRLEEALEDVWDGGNCSGLDGWIGPGRGAGEVDAEAVYDRDRDVRKYADKLRADGWVRSEHTQWGVRYDKTGYVEFWRFGESGAREMRKSLLDEGIDCTVVSRRVTAWEES